MIATIISIAVVVLILGSAIAYVVRAKKKGVKCIGCPAGSSCNGHCGSSQKSAPQEAKKPDTAATKEVVTICNCSSCTASSTCKNNSINKDN